MASGSFSFSNGDNTELMMNSQQESNLVHHHPIAPMQQINGPAPLYPNADLVIAVSPKTLLDGHRFVCQICYKGFQREQNLTLHRRVHSLPFNLRRTQRDGMPRKVYICPEPTCINHNPSHALGDFGGLKKHYLRKHCTDKKHKCTNCYKTYAVASDLKAHLKICLDKKYNCECGAGFSSNSRYNRHRQSCNRQMLEDAANDAPNIDVMNNSQRNLNNNTITSSINSTTSYLPLSYMGDSSSGSKHNNINNLVTDSTMSHLPTFNMGNRSVQTISNNNNRIGFTHLGPQSTSLNLARIPSNTFSLSSIQSQNEFQAKTGMGYFTNLMMNPEYNNENPENTSFMGNGSHYGSGEGSNLFSGSGFSSGEIRGFSMQEEHRVPYGTPNLVANMGLYGGTSRNNSAFNMVQPYARFSSGGGGSIMPQEHQFLFANEHSSVPENRGFSNIMNSFNNPLTGSGIGSSFINEGVHSSYNQGNYYGYADESRHNDYGAGKEVMNSGTLGATGVVAPYGEQYWNDLMGSF